jgi:D-glycero-D-manno-heptose 1,7-bisphosphate phosphatase
MATKTDSVAVAKPTTRAKPSPRKPRCVFLDRDGVVNTGGLIGKAADVHLIDGAAEAIASLKKAGFLVGLVTNQGGLSEDLEGNVRWKQRPLNRELLAEIHAELLRQLGPAAQLDFIEFCPHSVSVSCTCRKPKAGMLLAAAKKHKINLRSSFMVGDMATDVQAGINAGVTPILVLSGFDPDQKEKCKKGTLTFPSLKEAAQFILNPT